MSLTFLPPGAPASVAVGQAALTIFRASYEEAHNEASTAETRVNSEKF